MASMNNVTPSGRAEQNVNVTVFLATTVHYIHVGNGVLFTNFYTPLGLGIFAFHSI